MGTYKKPKFNLSDDEIIIIIKNIHLKDKSKTLMFDDYVSKIANRFGYSKPSVKLNIKESYLHYMKS